MNSIVITTREEIELCKLHGVDPLFWHRYIKIEPGLRILYQNELFGHTTISKKNIAIANEKYYRYCFFHGPLACENCGLSFYSNKNIESCYSSVYISHILSRSNCPEMAHDPRNQNKLCLDCHQKWESTKKHEMVIYMDNKVVIKELKEDYRIVA